MHLSCEHCLWWQQEAGGVETSRGKNADQGRCHRFPPIDGEFPVVHRATFCGEFTPRTYAAVARMAGAAQLGAGPTAPTPYPDSAERMAANDISGEVAATIAAAVATVLQTPHRIVGVQPVPSPGFGPWPLGAVLNTWAVEGRVQHFSSHKVR